MRKEVIFAIILGLILGGVILYGIQLANSSAQKAASSSINQPTPTISTAPTPTASLTITSPQDHSVISATGATSSKAMVNTPTIKITGKSLPNSTIALASSEDDILVTADASGNFSTDFKLTGGENVIEVSALSPDQETETSKISVIYTTAKLSSLTPPDLANVPVASNSQEIIAKTEEEILKAAKDRSQKTEASLIAKANNLLVGYAGTISDIKQGVFTLESGSYTLQVSFDTKTTIVKDGQTLKPELISIKDKAVIIGNLTGPEIIAAKRIVIYNETAPKFSKKIVFSPLLKIDIKKKSFTLKVNDKNQEVNLGKLIKLDLTILTLNQKIFGIVLFGANDSATLIQAKVI